MLKRITVFSTADHGGGPRWRDPVTAGELKLAVKRILGLDWLGRTGARFRSLLPESSFP